MGRLLKNLAAGGMTRPALVICLITAIFSLTIPCYFKFDHYPKQAAGRYFFLFQEARIDWSLTIHGFLLFSALAIGIVWLAVSIAALPIRPEQSTEKRTVAAELVSLFVCLFFGLTVIPLGLMVIFSKPAGEWGGFYSALFSPTDWWSAWGVALTPYIVYRLIRFVPRRIRAVKCRGSGPEIMGVSQGSEVGSSGEIGVPPVISYGPTASTRKPRFLVIVAVCLWLFLLGDLIFVVPVFAALYKDFGAKLPWLTKVLIGAADIFKDYVLLLGGTSIAAVILSALNVFHSGKKSYRVAFFLSAIFAVVVLVVVMFLPIFTKSGVAGGIQ